MIGGTFRNLPCAAKMDCETQEVEILKGLASKQTEGVLDYVTQVWLELDGMLVMPQGLDLNLV